MSQEALEKVWYHGLHLDRWILCEIDEITGTIDKITGIWEKRLLRNELPQNMQEKVLCNAEPMERNVDWKLHICSSNRQSCMGFPMTYEQLPFLLRTLPVNYSRYRRDPCRTETTEITMFIRDAIEKELFSIYACERLCIEWFKVQLCTDVGNIIKDYLLAPKEKKVEMVDEVD